ncbi:unnamed protein product [Caenorhabditis bovis]|uniref:XRN2-binding (XTBD) domain-containing protein n=1 Tax=Caenorhabditis bovis TaxID=2654633 RepID=A0A8S1F7H5_9PELO|nr:unnamed protein product [Caenorhabditis bovis]
MEKDWRGRPEETDVLAICRELSSYVASSDRNVNVARNIIQKIFKNKTIDMCSIVPNQASFADGRYNAIFDLVNGYSPFFETVVDDDGLCDELWNSVLEQCESTCVNPEESKDSVLMNSVSTYVTKLLPCDESVLNMTQRSSSKSQHIIKTPLQLFRPSSPLVNRIEIGNPDEMVVSSNANLQPRYVNVFCSLVKKTCSTASFPSPNRLLLLRYLLKQFHVFCLFETNDEYIDTLKNAMMLQPPFMNQLYAFFQTCLHHCPTASSFKDITACWLTYCRPWRYYNMANPSDIPPISKFIPFAKKNFDFYRTLLGKIIKKFSCFNLTIELTGTLRSIVEFSWKEPNCILLRNLGLNVQPHIVALLKDIKNVVVIQNEIIRKEKMENSSFINTIFGLSSTEKTEKGSQLIGIVESLLADCDKYLATRLMPELLAEIEEHDKSNAELNKTCMSTILTETPKSALPDHYIDGRTNLMILTPNGKRQVINGERKFDFSKSARQTTWHTISQLEFAPMVLLMNYAAENANRMPIVQKLAAKYTEPTFAGKLARLLMYPPVPNPDPNAASPIATRVRRRTPPMLKLRVFANAITLGLFCFLFLAHLFGRWFVAPALLFSFVFLIVAAAVDSESMGKEEEIEKERKPWESDESWELRRAFLAAHYDDYPRTQLQCLSQLFINVNLLGCEYSESLMEKINELGRGIRPNKATTKSGAYVKASSAKKRQAVTASDYEENTKKSKDATFNFELVNEKLGKLKAYLTATPHHLSGEQMLRSAAGNCHMRWHVKQVGTKIEILIDRYVALRHSFSQYCVDARDNAINSLIENFLSCTPSLNENEIWFDGVQPGDCYAQTMNRSFAKIKKTVHGQKDYKGLAKSLECVNLSIVQNTKKLQGWSQQFDLVAGDCLLATRLLSREECTRPKMAKIADEMASQICRKIADSMKIVAVEKTHTSLAFEDC